MQSLPLPQGSSHLHYYSQPTGSAVISMISSTTVSAANGTINTNSSSVVARQCVSFAQPVDEWSCESVAQWLAINDMAAYIDVFLDKAVNGEKLLSMDTSKLKVTSFLFFFSETTRTFFKLLNIFNSCPLLKMLGVKSQKDRAFIKAKIKELRVDDKKRVKQLLVEQQQQQQQQHHQQQQQQQLQPLNGLISKKKKLKS